MPGIEQDRAPFINANMIADIGQLPTVQPRQPAAAPTPGVNDLMQAFKDGFMTVDDIKKRQAARPIEASNNALQLQANDFKSKRLNEQEQLAPAQLALQKHKLSLDELATESRIKDLNANESNREARESLAQNQLSLASRLSSPDDSVRRKAANEQLNYSLEPAFTALTREPVPESFTLDKPAPVKDFADWTKEFVRDEVERGVAEYLQQYPQADPEKAQDAQSRAFLSEPLLKLREDLRQQASGDAGKEYVKYLNRRGTQKAVVYQGTPEYYEEMSKRIQAAGLKGKKDEINFESAKAGAIATAKASSEGTAAVSLDKTTVTRFNPKTGMNEDFRVIIDPRTGNVTSETLIASNPPAQTENQGNAKIYSSRMAFNNRIVNNLESGTFDPAAFSSTVQGLRFYPNRLKSSNFQGYESAKRNWVAAVLRRESGAAIAKSEFEGANQQYFPQDGDEKDVVKQKQAVRELVEMEMRSLAGPTGQSLNVPTPHLDQFYALLGVENPWRAPGASEDGATPASSGYEAYVGKTITLKNGRKGVVTKNPDGTYSLK